ncbi:regulator [Roseicella frigidaeris]|uniref:Regulator n=1 Tax=Roseicella frigidaeris TaxID=2230885 RepID=A0A327MB87_9PROT|nr:regulator [Roseicella frigidaeris]RAI59736.1 regulator [Roseicella frigidaeris]
MQEFRFDDRHVTWQRVQPIDAQVYVLAMDAALGIADVLIRFEPDRPGRLHRHVCDFSTFVVQGELRFWRPDGSLREIRPTGSHVRVAAHGEPHAEGAGSQAAIVLFSFRGSTGDMILYLGEGSEVVFRLGFPEFEAVLAQQVATGATAKLAPRLVPAG